MTRRKFTEAFLDDAAGLLGEMTITEIGRHMRCTSDALSKLLRGRGLKTSGIHKRPAPNRKDLPKQTLLALFRREVSAKQMAKRLDVSRTVIVRELRRHGIKPRGQSESMLIRQANMSPEERKQLASAAHAAVRGKKHSIEELRERARRCSPTIGEGERVLAKALAERGIQFQPQAPVDIYNVDLLVDRVAVEPSCSSPTRMKSERQRRRVEDLNKLGFSVLHVCYKRLDALDACLEKVIADIDEMRRSPSQGRENRMVWCGLKSHSIGRNQFSEPAVKSPAVEFLYARRW